MSDSDVTTTDTDSDTSVVAEIGKELATTVAGVFVALALTRASQLVVAKVRSRKDAKIEADAVAHKID